ncbi:MAG: hypothetical protein HC888_05430 [Candidatus Competibacteraceae bacterium]|nr:hypothetical protein [Candidatus Competibacteraceae bacterium]
MDNGHPFLTHDLCKAIQQELSFRTQETAALLLQELLEHPPSKGVSATPLTLSPKEIDTVVEGLYLGDEGRQNSNLNTIRYALTKTGVLDNDKVLDIYRDILNNKKVVDESHSAPKSHLKLCGIVQTRNNTLVVSNRIYERVFDAKWVQEHRPIDTIRQQRRRRSGVLFLGSILLALVIVVPALVVALFTQERSRENAVTSTHVALKETQLEETIDAFTATLDAMSTKATALAGTSTRVALSLSTAQVLRANTVKEQQTAAQLRDQARDSARAAQASADIAIAVREQALTEEALAQTMAQAALNRVTDLEIAQSSIQTAIATAEIARSQAAALLEGIASQMVDLTTNGDRLLAAIITDDGKIAVVNVATGNKEGLWPYSCQVRDAQFAPNDASRIVSVCTDERAYVWGWASTDQSRTTLGARNVTTAFLIALELWLLSTPMVALEDGMLRRAKKFRHHRSVYCLLLWSISYATITACLLPLFAR